MTNKKYNLTGKELDKVLSKTDFSDLNTHIGGCRSVAVGIGRVVNNNGIIAPTNEDRLIIHAFIEVDGSLFDVDGRAYKNKENVVDVVHSYNPFNGDRYKPEHFPLRSLTKDEIDSFLHDEYIITYMNEQKAPSNEEIATEVAKRVRSSIVEQY